MSTHPFRYAPALTIADNDNHRAGEHPLWQESAVFCFSNPEAGIAAFHRIGTHMNRRDASIYSWTSVGGKVVSRAKRTGLPQPPGPVTGATLDGVTFTTIDPLMAYRVQVDRDGVVTDVVFRSYTGPVAMNMDVGGAQVGPGHYNMLAEVRGTITAGGVTHVVDGVGFIDHSWGPRDLSPLLGHRWFMAVFDADNHVSTFPTIGPAGRGMVGYVVIDGELSMVTAVKSVLLLDDDNLHLEGCRATITDALGRRLSLVGETVGEYNVQPLGHGYYAAQHGCRYESDGRVGKGWLEWGPARTIPPWHREALGLRADDFWLTGVDAAS